jgi:chromatin segregation and condensation protein Rec8/ScpA/Scc1 (kleisin family)
LIAPTDAFGLLEQFSTLLQAYEAEEPTYALEPSSALDFEASCLWVLRVLGGPGKVTDFRELLTSQSTRAERVVCFIALLEMARVGWVLVRQEEHLGPIRLEAMVGEDVDFSAIMGRVEREAAS